MNLNVILSFLAAIMAAGIMLLALHKDSKSFVQRVFELGMLLFVLEAGLNCLAYFEANIAKFLFWYKFQFIISTLLSAVWLLFSICYARSNYREQISKWKWVLILVFVFNTSMALPFQGSFFSGNPVLIGPSEIFVRLGWSGYLWYFISVIIGVLILMNLERTFRHATGHMRWQTKFMFIGVASIFGIRLFLDSHALLFNGIDFGLVPIDMGAFLIAGVLILRSLFRGKPLNASLQLSHQFLYSSFTILIVGIYFVVVSVVAWLALHFDWIRSFHIAIFLIFVAIVGIATLLVSDRLRISRKRFISRHFKRPIYNYQRIWEDFTARTATLTKVEDLCNAIVNMVSSNLEILSVTIWIINEKTEQMRFGASTVFTLEQANQLQLSEDQGTALIQALSDENRILDLDSQSDEWVKNLKSSFSGDTKEARVRYCVPLRTHNQLIGIMMLSEKIYYESLTFEDTELLKTIADQAAAALLNLRLSESLRQIKELEAFQAMSAFFMHDLKNLASKLSLVTQNLPIHIDNPEFRTEAFRIISQSVSKINDMSTRLSLLSQKLELAFRKTDLNEFVAATISEMKKFVEAAILQRLDSVPLIQIDQEQIHKVLENLIMNANDAVSENGKIAVETSHNEKWVQIVVRDNGSGMTKEFIDKDLFRPFRTTKKKGMGIGLFHCKTIVEAHGGRIEVESAEGEGTLFRVLLPLIR